MKFFREHKMSVILTGCCVFVVAVLIYFGTHTSDATVTEDAVVTVFTPVQKFFSNIGRGLYDITHCIGEIGELRAQNSELASKNAELENKTVFNSELMEENDRLKAMLELRRNLEDDGYELTACSVTACEPSNWFASFNIDKGKNSGIQQGQVVISADRSLVGKITRVGNNWAEVMTVVDPEFSAGAKIKRSNHMGVAEGDSEYRESYRLKLSYLSRETNIQIDDIIVTSGLGGVFPDGFKIGKVIEIKEDNVAISRYAVLEPCANLKDLREVFVVTNNLDIVADRENENMKSAREDAEKKQDEIDKEVEKNGKMTEEESIKSNSKSSDNDKDDDYDDRDDDYDYDDYDDEDEDDE